MLKVLVTGKKSFSKEIAKVTKLFQDRCYRVKKFVYLHKEPSNESVLDIKRAIDFIDECECIYVYCGCLEAELDNFSEYLIVYAIAKNIPVFVSVGDDSFAFNYSTTVLQVDDIKDLTECSLPIQQYEAHGEEYQIKLVAKKSCK